MGYEDRKTLTPEMQARVDARRVADPNDPFGAWFAEPAERTDEEIAEQIEREDAAKGRDIADEALRWQQAGLRQGQVVRLRGKGWHGDDLEGDAHMPLAGKQWVVEGVTNSHRRPGEVVVWLEPAEGGPYTCVYASQVVA